MGQQLPNKRQDTTGDPGADIVARPMNIELTEVEVALCIAALEYAAKDFWEGHAASERLKKPMPDGVTEMADQMDALRSKLLTQGQRAP